MVKISVIIPVYNTENFLRRCLDSVCNQTLRDIEVICVNDCSPDSSLKILQEYARNDNRIKIVDFTENKGVSVARNTGIDMAKGEYLDFVDSDDFIDLDFYEKLYNKAVETGADAVKGEMKIISDISSIEKEVFYDINKDVKQNFAYFYHSFTTAIYNTHFITKNAIKFPEGLNSFEDPYFSILAGIHYKKVEVVDGVKYYYINNENSLTKNIDDKKAFEAISSINQLIDVINKFHITQEHLVIVYSFLLQHIFSFCLNRKFSIYNNKEALNVLTNLYANIKNKEYFLNYYFTQEKKMKNRLLLTYAKNKLSKVRFKND